MPLLRGAAFVYGAGTIAARRVMRLWRVHGLINTSRVWRPVVCSALFGSAKHAEITGKTTKNQSDKMPVTVLAGTMLCVWVFLELKSVTPLIANIRPSPALGPLRFETLLCRRRNLLPSS